MSMYVAYLAMAGAFGSTANAHVGPPFPLMVDVPAGEDVISVWADPDIGEATFYIVIEKPDGTEPSEPDGVSMWTQPLDARIEKVIYPAERQRLRNRMQFEVKPEFDRRDMWDIGFRIVRHGEPVEVVAQVESTPPGTGSWDLLIYLFPFAFVGVLWVMALSRMRRRRRELLTRIHGRATAQRASDDAVPGDTDDVANPR